MIYLVCFIAGYFIGRFWGKRIEAVPVSTQIERPNQVQFLDPNKDKNIQETIKQLTHNNE